MRKILILKGRGYHDNWGDYAFMAQHGEPHEVDDETFAMLRNNLHRLSYSDDEVYRLIEYIQPKEIVDVIASVRELVAKDEAEKEKRRIARAAATAKSEATKLENKRRTLEKLKKELGEV